MLSWAFKLFSYIYMHCLTQILFYILSSSLTSSSLLIIICVCIYIFIVFFVSPIKSKLP